MANKYTSVLSSVVSETNRFEPKLFIFQSTLNKCKEKYLFLSLGDKEKATGIKRGQSPKPNTYKDKQNGQYIFVRTADVKKYVVNTESAVYIDEVTFSSQKSNRFSSQDILISVVGNYLGSTCVIPEDIAVGTFNDNSARISIVDENISPYYISAFLNSIFGQKLIQSLATRTGQKILSAGNVKKISLPIIKDSDLVSKYETAIKKESQSNILITKAKQLFYNGIDIKFRTIRKEKYYSVDSAFFTNEDLWTPMYSFPLYVNTLEAIKEKWEIVNLGKITDIRKGDEVGSDAYIGYLDKRTTDVPFIRTSDIVNYEIDQYPDFYIPIELFNELDQGFQPNDILFTKDGKIGMVGMVTEFDKAIISSGFVGLRLNKWGKDYNITQEYLFIALSIKEIGLYASKRRTVIASTIPHLREDRLKDIEIPILDNGTIDEITDLVRRAFLLKDEKKRLIKEVHETMNDYFEI